ncbi:hypothetical protein HMI55_002817 [Coelomomyces lativittatus]|nr:hypothetical protein HMI55_002817 [Coelomomyces lativittatus]
MSLFNDETLQSKSSSLLSQPEGLLNHLVHIASTLIFLDPEVIRPVLFNSTILNKLGIEQGKLLLLKSIYSQHQLELTWISIYEDSSKYATHDISTILLVENCNQNGQFIKGIDFRLQLNIRLHVYDPPQLHYPPITPYIHFGEAEKKKNSSVSLASFNLTKEENWKIHTLRKTHQSQLFSILKNISKRFSSLIESVLQSRPIDENCKLLCEKLEGLFDPSSTSSPSSTDQDEDVSFTFSDAMEDDSFTLSSPLDGKALFEETIRRIEERALKAKETSQFDEEIVFSALPDEIEFNATEDEASNEDEERKNIHKREIPTSHLQYAKERTKPFDSIPPSSYSSSTSQSTEKNPSSFEVPISSESHSNNLVAKPLMNEPRFTCLPLRSNERISDMTKLLSIKTYIEELKSTWNRIELPKHEARQATYIKKYASKFDSIQKEIELIHESQIPTFMMKISAKAVTMEDLDLLKTALDVIVYELCRKEFLLSLLSQTQALKTDLSSISSSDSTLPASTLSEITMPLPSYDHHQKPEKLMSAASLAEPNPAHLHPSDLKSSLIKQKDVDSLSSPIDEVHGDESTTLDEESVDVDSDEEGEENEDDDDEDESNDEDVKNFIVEDHLVEWDIAEAEEKQIELLEAIRELFALYPSEWELFNALKQFCLRLAANKPLPERASAFLFLKITHSLVSKDLPSSTSMSQAWSETYSRCCSMISDFEKTHLDFHLVQRIASPVKKINISSSTDFPVFVPSFLEKVLEEHQIKGIRFMWDRIVSKKGGCILAHAMGLGKSLQVITFIACLCNEILKNKDSIPTHLHSRHFILFSPKTVLHSFWNELYKWVPKSFFQLHQFDAYLLEGNRLQRHSIVQTWNEKGGILFLTYDAAKSFTQPSEKIAMDELELKRLLFSQVALAIFDEAHIFKNHETQLYTLVKESLTTCSRIALTGTPLQNNLIEYFNMTEIISPGFLGTLDQFKSNFLLRIMDGQSSDSTRNQKRTSEYTLALLREVLSEFILREDNRLLKKKLPPLHEYVIYIELTSTQRKLALALFDNMGSDSRYLMVLGQRLIHIFNHPTVLIQSLSSPKGFSTQITSSDSSTSSSLSPSVSPDSNFTSVPMPISSESSPHASSSSSQTNTTRNLEPSNPELLDWVKEFSKLPDLSSLQQSSKMMVCMEIVKYSLLNEEKIIIFSQCLKSLTYLQGELTHRNIKWCRLDGQSSSKARQDLIHSFNTSVEMNVFLISTKTGGTGINLYSASRVIILDFQWNPTTEEQGIGRNWSNTSCLCISVSYSFHF